MLSKAAAALQEMGLSLVGIGLRVGSEQFVECGVWDAPLYVTDNYEVFSCFYIIIILFESNVVCT